MKTIKLFFVLTFLIQISLHAQVLKPTANEQFIIERFEYLKHIKEYIGEKFWSSFATNQFPGTVVYFTDSSSYFINPKPEMANKVNKYSIIENEYDWNIWKLRMPLDSAKFVMETQFQFDSKTKNYINYRTPVLFCSSPELTQKEKVIINTLQEWSVAAMHEMFHQYQYSNEAIMTYVLRLYDEKKMIDMDSLQGIYLANQAFRDTLAKENELLKQAIAATSFDQEKKLFSDFLKLRGKRNLAYFKKHKFWVNTPENFWEKLEGTALIVEQELKANIQNITPPAYIVEHDKMYNPSFMYDEKESSEVQFYSELNDDRFYVGTTGYNMIKLLEKNNVDYKKNFFNYASLPLEMQLKYFYKIK